jgi:opacity protein-like surface antigen
MSTPTSARFAVFAPTIVAALASTVGALCVPAYGADLSAIRPAAIQPASNNWTGIYVGANFGGVFTSEDANTPIGAASPNPSGVLGGFQLGYNYQFSPSWLLGVEAEFDLTSAQGSTNFFTPASATTLTSDHNWYDTIGGRLGYVMGPLLVYVKGGGAWMNADYHFIFGGGGVGGSTSINSTRPGWTFGTGLEYMMTPQWSAKVAYDYLDFGTTNIGAPGGPGAAVRTEVHEVKAGLNWHWNP